MTDFVPLPNVLSGGGQGPAPAFSPELAPVANYPPAPQVSPTQALTTQMANGSVPVHTQPTNIPIGIGNDSLLAQLAKGQITLNQSTYGQAAPGNIIATGAASAITVGSPPNYIGA